MKHTIDDVVEEILRLTGPCTKQETLARGIYEWMKDNIIYDIRRLQKIEQGLDQGLPHQPEDTIRNGKGVCSDMAWLYVNIANHFGIRTSYAVVETGKPVKHACAIAEINGAQVQVDPAKLIFGARHQSYTIMEPEVLAPETDNYHPQHTNDWPTTKWTPYKTFQALAIGVAFMAGGLFIGYLVEHEAKTRKIKYYQTEKRFETKHGEVNFSIEPSAECLWKETLFYREAQEGEMYSKQILDTFLKADKDGNNNLSEKEARAAREEARNNYLDR